MENSKKQRLVKLMMEIIWWLITVTIVFMVAQPLWGSFAKYSFVYELIMFGIIFITYTRYLFFMKYTFLAEAQVVKFILIFVSLPFAFYLIQVFFNYQDFLEKQNEGMLEFQEYFIKGISFQEHTDILTYMSKVYSFLGMSAIIAVIISPFRLLVSYWRVYNKTGRV